MRFDDSLETVLAADVSSPFGAQSAWRQLVDLIGRGRVPASAEAIARLQAIRAQVPPPVRAASARSLAFANPPAALVSMFAEDELSIAAPVLRIARLMPHEWIAMLPTMPSANRSILRHRRDLGPTVNRALESYGPSDFVLPPAELSPAEPAVSPVSDLAESAPPIALHPDEAATIPAATPIAEKADLPVSSDMPPELVVQPTSEATPEPTPSPALESMPIAAEVPIAPTPSLVDAHDAADIQPADLTEQSPVASEIAPPPSGPSSALLPTAEAASPLAVADAMPIMPETPAPAAEQAESTPQHAPMTPAAPNAGPFVSIKRVPLGMPLVTYALRRAEAAEAADPGAPTGSVAEPVEPVTPPMPAPVEVAEAAQAADGADSVASDGPVEPAMLAPVEEAALAQPASQPEIHLESATETVTPVEFVAPVETAAPVEPVAEAIQPRGPFQISEIVARIDAFQRDREDHLGDDHVAPSLFADSLPAPEGFRFETDSSGLIRWVQGVSRAALIGVSLDGAAQNPGAQVDGAAAGAFRRRAGFANARLLIDGSADAAGQWRITGIPVFDRETGRFTGYRGTGRRPRADERADPGREGRTVGTDAVRQLVHELRTPTTAIAGFAEMIEGEMLGPVPAPYRSYAGTIRHQAMGLLGAIDDLDTAARLDSNALDLRPESVAVQPLLSRIVDDLRPLASLRRTNVSLFVEPRLMVHGDERAVERLFGRLLATMVAAGGADETIMATAAQEGAETVGVTIDRPRAFAAYQGESLLSVDAETADESSDAPLLGTGFALRLVRNLAAELGGSLTIGADRLTLRLPAAVNRDVGQASTN